MVRCLCCYRRELNDVYVLNQFSIYRDSPMISNRVLNETTYSAYLTNKWYLDGKVGTLTNCDQRLLRACTQRFLPATFRGNSDWLS